MIGSRVLDLGSGSTARFAREVSARYPDTEVVSYSAGYNNAESRKKVVETTKNLDGARQLIVGRAKNLPFADKSFNKVVVLHVSQYLSSDEFESMIKEIASTVNLTTHSL